MVKDRRFFAMPAGGGEFRYRDTHVKRINAGFVRVVGLAKGCVVGVRRFFASLRMTG